MLTKPNTKGREMEVDDLLAGLRSRLVSGDFQEIEIIFEYREMPSSDGFVVTQETGGFTMTAVPAERHG